MVLLLQYTLIFSAVLILVALGGMFSERSGIINLGLEGIMVFGAMAGGMVMVLLPDSASKFTIVVLTLVAAAIAGMLSSLLIGVACIYFKADQTLVGTAVNMLATAAATVIVKAFNTNRSNGTDFSAKLDYVKGHAAFMFNIGSLQLSWFVVIAAVLLVAAIVLFYKTKFALRLRACGEHPQAADSVGINVYKMRYAGVLMSGFFAGLGGIIYIAAANSTWHFDYGVAGAGFLALAVMIFGQWKPERIAWSAVLFAVFRSLSNVYMGIDFLHALPISGTVYNMFPYIVSLIVLAFTSQKSRAPKAEGIPYDKGAR
ncbi:ABC transporter permease [Butyrivibrio sp. YAB3001]|uniref:ABC transporter permease n=1 Tax=Butyrivibrio sp. YAB3001 TaxID=1520812 RepID=UPI0008F628B8|nr:ABC transporter permease [Butyrivibrio sp. YAB3001]SFB68700.1 simple sugar transport system permease protein [Butyrivibrio sp. YAB3001]